MKSRLRNDLHRAQRSAILFTSVLAGILGFCLYLQLSKGPVLKNPRIAKPTAAPTGPTARQPAAAPKTDITTHDLKLQCSIFRTANPRIQVPSSVERIRIYGRECDLDAGPGDSIVVSGVTNGSFSGTLLLPKPGYFISDYIPIEASENTIVLSYKMHARNEQKLPIQIVRAD